LNVFVNENFQTGIKSISPAHDTASGTLQLERLDPRDILLGHAADNSAS